MATEEEVELPHTGIVTTFCVVNVQFYGQEIEVPYVCATVLLDGADIGLFGLVQESRSTGSAWGCGSRPCGRRTTR